MTAAAASPPSASPDEARRLARRIYFGVALASGGIALYVPLVLSSVGAAFSGLWAATILFGTNLGRVMGSQLASRHAVLTERPAAIVANIVFEGCALFAMAFAGPPWAYALAALAAGLGSGMSFPGLKGWLLKLHGLEPARLFAGLSLSLRLGMLWGYLAGSFVPLQHLAAVFAVVFATFCGYAFAMHRAMRRIAALPVPAAVPPVAAGEVAPPPEVEPLPLPALFRGGGLFWFLMIQPTVAMSLHVPRHVPELAVTTTYWVTTATILLLQTRVTAMARGLAGHARWLLAGHLALATGFALMALAGARPAAVVGAAVLVAVGQIFFVPSSDVLAAAAARRAGVPPGPLMARQMMFQNIGVMLGCLAAGALFDLGERLGRPWLLWALLCTGALAALVAMAMPLRRRMRILGDSPRTSPRT